MSLSDRVRSEISLRRCHNRRYGEHIWVVEGDRERRLADLYRRHASSVHAFARRRVDAPTAEEVVAETFVVAWHRLDELSEPALPWLYGVARRLIANQLRGADRRRALLTRLAEQPSGGTAETSRGVLLDALSSLRARDREALLLAAWEGLSTEEIAVALGCSPAAARTRLHRARTRLRVLLDQQDPPPGGSAVARTVEVSRETR